MRNISIFFIFIFLIGCGEKQETKQPPKEICPQTPIDFGLISDTILKFVADTNYARFIKADARRRGVVELRKYEYYEPRTYDGDSMIMTRPVAYDLQYKNSHFIFEHSPIPMSNVRQSNSVLIYSHTPKENIQTQIHKLFHRKPNPWWDGKKYISINSYINQKEIPGILNEIINCFNKELNSFSRKSTSENFCKLDEMTLNQIKKSLSFRLRFFKSYIPNTKKGK
ncbi:MAG TPA: hypothetical protein VK177_06490 [Flavobacteriales bacterium]|nr:hypothetical protein [Flavobacteriales bacterium]